MTWNTPELDASLAALATLADGADKDPVWPATSWEALGRAGALAWAVPVECGGLGLNTADLQEAYQCVAGSCLTSCFILSQRDAAIRRVRDLGSDALRRELLRPLACGGHFATVGLSQLTTSRQHGAPALAARLTATELILNGVIPWVTGAAEAQHLVIGATLDDGRQVLTVVPSDIPGLRVGPPLALAALTGSLTAEVHCDQVRLDRRWLLAGPAERVLAGRGAGGLETSSLALGLAGTAIASVAREAVDRPALSRIAERLKHTRTALHQELRRLAQDGGTPAEAAALRARANTLVLRATQAALTASKGTGFVRPHPAQRWARQALFFLVWSCPQPALEGTLDALVPNVACDR